MTKHDVCFECGVCPHCIRADERERIRKEWAARVERLPEERDLDPWDWYEVVEIVLALLK